MKPKFSDGKTRFLHFRANEQEQRTVGLLAQQLKLSASELLRLLIARGLEALLSEDET